MGGDIAIFNRVREGTLQVHQSLCSSNKSKYGKIILLIVHVYIIFALPDYSSDHRETPIFILWETHKPRPRV